MEGRGKRGNGREMAAPALHRGAWRWVAGLVVIGKMWHERMQIRVGRPLMAFPGR
jgi:hypothetical protein